MMTYSIVSGSYFDSGIDYIGLDPGCGCNDLADTLSEYCSYQSTEIKLPRLKIHIHYRVPLIADI
ncbi:MAG: hypothetical protein WCE33_10160 [Nitrososphaeraceae archaeon]